MVEYLFNKYPRVIKKPRFIPLTLTLVLQKLELRRNIIFLDINTINSFITHKCTPFSFSLSSKQKDHPTPTEIFNVSNTQSETESVKFPEG